MSDLVRREDVENTIQRLCDLCGEYERHNGVMCGACNLDNFIRVLDDIPSAEPEQTAKVEKIHMEYASEGDFDIYECGDCENCGETVMRGDKFCHECGARLEWK